TGQSRRVPAVLPVVPGCPVVHSCVVSPLGNFATWSTPYRVAHRGTPRQADSSGTRNGHSCTPARSATMRRGGRTCAEPGGVHKEVSMASVADQLVEVLSRAGVSRVYGVVGDSLNPVVDAIRRSRGSARGGIDWVSVRNEEAGAFAAAAEAQITGTLAVCAGSCGPGNLHLLQGLYDAQRSGAPVLAIASHIPTDQIGTGFFQETHPQQLFQECSNYCELISHPGQLPRMARIGVQNATGARGVSVLVLPGDVAQQNTVHPTGTGVTFGATPAVVPPAGDIDRLAERIE